MRRFLLLVLLAAAIGWPSPAAVFAQDVPRYPRCEAAPADTICEVDAALSAAELAASPDPIFLHAGIVYITITDPSADLMIVTGDVVSPMRRADGSDQWVLALQIPRVEAAFFEVQFLPAYRGGRIDVENASIASFTGPDAPPLPQPADPLIGILTETTLDGWTIGIYTPPAYDPNGAPYPVVYMTDGQSLATFAAALEPAIVAGDVPAVVLVGLHARTPTAQGDDTRAADYLPGVDAAAFAAHEAAFVTDLVALIEADFNVRMDAAGRAVMGLSNGAAFSAQMAVDHPDVFGNAIVLSLGYPIVYAAPADGVTVRYWLSYGTLEAPFALQTIRLLSLLQAADQPVQSAEYVAGHGFGQWVRAFPLAVGWLFGGANPAP